MKAIELAVTVPVPPERAFAVFTEELDSWWPPEYTWSGPQALVTIGMECGPGGLCYEIGPHGFRCDWGRVLAWDPPSRLVLSWQIGAQREPVPDPAHASEVEVRFHPHAGATRVSVEHRCFGRHGDGADNYRDGLASPEGWPHLLRRYTAACG